MNENLKGYYLNKTGDRVKQLLDRQFIVPTLDSIPNSQTKTWQDGEYTVTFRIGELCRINVNGEWVFYRLYDVINDGCVWQKANTAEIPDLSNYYTKEEINNIVEQIEPIDLLYLYVSENGEIVLDYSNDSIIQDGYISEHGELILEFNMQ